MIPEGINGVVFFDGVCGLCNSFVDFLMSKKGGKNFRYATLQGDTATKVLDPDLTAELKSVVYYRNGKTYLRSSAALYILKDLGGLWSLLFVFIIVPPFIRNAVYDLVGRNRYKWFGIKENCRIPTPEERALFLP